MNYQENKQIRNFKILSILHNIKMKQYQAKTISILIITCQQDWDHLRYSIFFQGLWPHAVTFNCKGLSSQSGCFGGGTLSSEISEIGAGAGANAMSCEIDEAGPTAAPELVNSIVARRGLVLCFSQSSGKNTPVVTLMQLSYRI